MPPQPAPAPPPLRSRPAREVAAALQQSALFAGLSEPALQALARAGSLLRIPKGQVLFSQDDPADTLYLVHTGCILISLATADGRELAINEMRPGDFFGELALLQGQTRSANAVAREASEVLCLPGDVFLAQLESEPRVMRRLLQTLAERLRVSGERESALAFVAAHESPGPFTYYYNPAPPVEFGAPGINLTVAWLNKQYAVSTGNSFAAPHIAGLVALIRSKHPELTPFEIKTVLRACASNTQAA